MKIDVPGRGAVDIRRVAIVGPTWTDLEMFSETCGLLQRTADAVATDADPIGFGWLPWHPTVDDGHRRRQMVHDLVTEYQDGSPCIDGVCLLEGWRTDGDAAFAAAVANTCGAVVKGLKWWLDALAPADEKKTEASGQ